MSLANTQSQKLMFTVFALSLIVSISSCKKENSKIANFKSNVQNFRSSQPEDARNLVTLSALIKKAIVINKTLSEKSANNRILNFSRTIDKNQKNFLKAVTEIANSKLIILNSILKVENKSDGLNADSLYFESIEEQLKKEIALLYNIKAQSTDKDIHHFATKNLQKQKRLLALTKKFKLKIINNTNNN